MLNENHEFVVPHVGDIVFLKVNFGDGRVIAEMYRADGSPLYWGNETKTGIVRARQEPFKGIMCNGEIKQALTLVARVCNLRGVESCEPDEARKKAGWIAFRFV